MKKADHIIKKPEMSWTRCGFKAMKESWSVTRIEQDGKLLKKAFAQAARVPVLKEALDWARAHGIEFFIDHQAVNCGGYYMPGTGVVAITKKNAGSLQDLVRIIVHETRHAWQDYHGMLRRDSGSFTDYFIKNALIEADAYAFESRALDEFRTAKLKANRKNDGSRQERLDRIQSALKSPKYLAGKFLEWFSTYRPKLYGDAVSKHIGKIWGVYAGPRLEINAELRGFSVARQRGMDLSSDRNVLTLGKTFTGKNYLSELAPEILTKKILCPSLAESFYAAANDDQKKLTAKIRKCYLDGKKPRRSAG